MKLVRHVRRMARRNPFGLPEEIVLGVGLVGAIIAGAWVFRRMNAGASGAKSWVEITAAPTIVQGTTYRVTMDPIAGATSDQGATGFDQFSDPAAGGGVTVYDNLDSTWVDQDPTRWHFQFLATTTIKPTLDSATRIWAFQ
jgi:hypothetical protein